MAMQARNARTRKLDRNRGRSRYRFTADQVLRMIEAGIIPDDEDVELFNGVLYKMTKGELHNAIVTVLAAALRRLLPENYQVREEKSCSADPRTMPEPDVMVYRGGPWDHVPNLPPLAGMSLVVEVSHHSQADHRQKLVKYARSGLPIYWIVDAESMRVSVHTGPLADGDPARFADIRTFTPGTELPVVVDGAEVGRIAVADLFPAETTGPR